MITRIDELSTEGFITYPNQTILIPVWAELCMNDPFFNKIVALNESIRASKIKLNAYTYVLNTSDILSITMKETDKANMYGMEDEGSNYVRVRVKTKTIADSLKYQKILGRLFTLYNNQKDIILTKYRKYLGPKFLKNEETNPDHEAQEVGEARTEGHRTRDLPTHVLEEVSQETYHRHKGAGKGIQTEQREAGHGVPCSWGKHQALLHL